ncbi:MAG TPA: hypothetical protein VG538_05905 [Vicinamibacterales bacterium]|nr:hypothetical protein [Vicinamibacterales bacterium]
MTSAEERLELLERLIACSRCNRTGESLKEPCICADRDALVQAQRWAMAWRRELEIEEPDDHDGVECGTCYDGAVVCDTCDHCEQRHCPDCDPCVLEVVK